MWKWEREEVETRLRPRTPFLPGQLGWRRRDGRYNKDGGWRRRDGRPGSQPARVAGVDAGGRRAVGAIVVITIIVTTIKG